MRAISLPVNDKIVEEIIKISVAKINPKSLSKEAMDLARPYATVVREIEIGNEHLCGEGGIHSPRTFCAPLYFKQTPLVA